MTSALKYTNALQGQRILVLGGSSGVGFCVAEAALEHGATVIISSSRQAKLDRAIARLQEHARNVDISVENVSSCACDLGDPDTMDQTVVNLLDTATLGGHRINHVVFTAGDMPQITSLNAIAIANIESFSTVRLFGCIILAKHLPGYIELNGGSSFTLTGGIGSWRPSPGAGIEACFGSALEGLARGLARDMSPLRVNCVTVGAVRTEL